MFVKALLNRWKVCLRARLSLQVGLDAAGKTTILYKLKLGEIVTTIPTIGKLLLHGIQDGCHYSCMPRLLSGAPASMIKLS